VEKLVASKLFWRKKRVLITGHTGFKGAWLALLLNRLGAETYGLSLNDSPLPDGIYSQGNISQILHGEYFVDINDLNSTQMVLEKVQPEIVFHLAAQSLVSDSYLDPYKTFSTNILGTLNVIESTKILGSPTSLIVVTSDKCYENNEMGRPFVETDSMGGVDPYSASKGCAEILTRSIALASLQSSKMKISSARAGNVFGGGDWNKDRLVPDVFRALSNGKSLQIKSPNSIRPWQHVFEALIGYVKLAEMTHSGKFSTFEGFNFAPPIESQISVMKLVDQFKASCPSLEIKIVSKPTNANFESSTLFLSSEKARKTLNWVPILSLNESVHLTSEWYMGMLSRDSNMCDLSMQQIEGFLGKYFETSNVGGVLNGM
jgi:CDP-glucose 4,6-dehydratase